MGAEVVFVCRVLDTVAVQILATTNALVHWLPSPSGCFVGEADAPPHAAWAGVSQTQDARETLNALNNWVPDWVVVDHYAFDARWHRVVRAGTGSRLMVIDDTADRELEADILLDQNWSADHRSKYAGCLQRPLLWLCGPRFALLSSAYRDAPRYVFSEKVRSIGIFMGGTDPGAVSARVLTACRAAGFTGPVEVVSTSSNPHLDDLYKACAADGQATLTLDATDLAAFFARHDIQIGAGGGATWERCCLGTPALAIAVAANQVDVLEGLAKLGAVRAVDEQHLTTMLRDTMGDSVARRFLSNQASALVDGDGAKRVALALLRDQLQLRPATPADARLLYDWRNHPAVRAVSVHQEPIDFDVHERWLQSVLLNPARRLYVAQVGTVPVGSIRFDRMHDQGAVPRFEVSLYTDPQLQGLGLGKRLLLAGEQTLLRQQSGRFISIASVLPGNAASQRLFESLGYHGGPWHYEKNIGHQLTITIAA